MIVERIETNFKLYSQIKKHYDLAVFDYRSGNNKTGGSNGNALISDPTSNKALKMIEPPYIPAIFIRLKNDTIEQSLKIKQPLKWIQLYKFVKGYSEKDDISKKIFHARYIKKEPHDKTTIKLDISSRKYYDIRNNLMGVALAGACELKLVKIM